MGGTGEVVTYDRLEQGSNRLAQLLRGRGLTRGDVVAVLMENNSRYHEVTWAARRSGLYFTTVNRHLTADEAAYIIEDSGAKAVIASEALAETVRGLGADRLPGVGVRLMTGEPCEGWESYEEAVAAWPAEPIADESEGDLLQYSSGTTGRPKGIKRRLADLPTSLETDLTVRFLKAVGFEDGGVYLSPAPLYHTAPIMWSMAVQRLGGTVVVMEEFDAERSLELIERRGVTLAQMVPSMFVRILKLPEETRAAYDLSSLRTVVHAAAPCPIPVKRAMIELFGPIVTEYYSSSEGAGFTLITSREWLERPGSVGRPLLGRPRIVGPEGEELPPGTVGDLYFEDAVPFEYLNAPEKTAAARDARGWTTVGDMGRLDEDGYLYIVERRTDLILSGGVNVYPQEVENLLVSHPKVMDAAVIGVPDEDFGERVHAVVQPLRWEDAGPDLEQDLIAYCRESLAKFKCPRSVDFDPQLPRLDNGKLYKRTIRERYRRA
jgi:fatty-acyl-CoA synthase